MMSAPDSIYPYDGVRLKFTSKERDAETGLDYFGARYMSSAQGRFTSADAPFADQHVEDPQSWNLYSYVRNNPLRMVDPTGGQATDAGVYAQLYVQGKITKEQMDSYVAAESKGSLIGAAMVFGGAALLEARAMGSAVLAWAYGNPDKVQRYGEMAADAIAPPGTPSFAGQFERLGATTAASVEKKLSQYLLDASHPKGGDKAAWFKSALGFEQSNMQDLAKQFVFDGKKAVQTGVTEFGTKYNQTITVMGANGRKINVVTAWIRNPDDVVRLVTAVPEK